MHSLPLPATAAYTTADIVTTKLTIHCIYSTTIAMPTLIYTVLIHRYNANSYGGDPMGEHKIEVHSNHVSLRAANRVVIDEMDLDEDLDRDLTGESRNLSGYDGMGYVRHTGGRLDAKQSPDENEGTRMTVVVKTLNEHVEEYGEEEDDYYDDEDEGEGVDEERNVSALESTLKRSAPAQDDDIQYMGTKKVKGP